MNETPRRRPLVAPRYASALIAGALLAVLAPRVYGQARIAVVDMQRAARESQQGRRALGNLRTLFQKRQEDLNGRQDALTKMRDELQNQAKAQNATKASAADRAELERRSADYQKQLSDLQQNYVQYQQELSQREAELNKSIYSNMDKVIRQVGAQAQYLAVFDQQGVVWSPQDMDMTDRVIQMYNAQYPAGSEPAATGTAPAARPGAAAPRPGAPATGRSSINPHPREESHPAAAH